MQGRDRRGGEDARRSSSRPGGPEWSDRARYEIGRIELAAGRFDKAVSAFEALEKASPKSPLLPPRSQLRRAEALGKLDRRDEAETLLRSLAEGPNQSLAAQAADVLGGSLLARGKAAEALADARRGLVASSPPRRSARSSSSTRPRPAQALGKLDDGRARFLKVAETAPDDPLADDALVRAAGIALEARDFAAAKSLARSLPAKFPRPTAGPTPT